MTLGRFEQRISTAVGVARQQRGESLAPGNPKRCDREGDGALHHRDGAAAELAFCSLAELYPSPLLRHPLRTGGPDIRLPDGRWADVKHTRYQTGNLLVPCKPSVVRETINLYVLLVGTFPTYEFRGWIEAAYIKQLQWIEDLGKGDAWTLTQAQIHDELVVWR